MDPRGTDPSIPRRSTSALDYLRHVSEFLHDELDADPRYSHTLTANPAAPPEGKTTIWGTAKPYELGELSKVVPFNWKAPRVAQSGVGRNVDLYRDLMAWAGQKVNADLPALAAAHVRNGEFEHPLSAAEVAATARSVERYRARWAVRGWHSRRFIARQTKRGAKSKRGPDPNSARSQKPWEAAGVSRATWYRRRKAERETS